MAVTPPLFRDLCAVAGASVEVDAPLAPLTTIRTGGLAEALVTVDGVAAAAGVLAALITHETVHCFLGAGSDLLVADEGFRGVVVRLSEGFRQIEGLDASAGPVVVTAGAAVWLPDLARACAEAGCSGLEFACGIPGSVGGGVATNAGAYGRAFSDVLSEVQIVDDQGARWVPASGLEWEYRRCRLPQGALVTRARFVLGRDDPKTILESHRSILEMRRAVQPQGVSTFGSTFKNPSGGPAGRLLDAAGLKGERRGGAEVSSVHANFVINLGQASTADVLSLMNYMRDRVHETSGVTLEPEVRLLGAGFPWESSAGGARRHLSADG